MGDIELDESSIPFPGAPEDRRPKVPEPPPVRLVAVEDVTFESSEENVPKLDDFYVGLLRFERDPREPGVVYRAENVRLRFKIEPAPVSRDDMRAMGVEVPSLADLELLFIEHQIQFAKERTLAFGHTTFLLRDPAGNWLRIGQVKRII